MLPQNALFDDIIYDNKKDATEDSTVEARPLTALYDVPKPVVESPPSPVPAAIPPPPPVQKRPASPKQNGIASVASPKPNGTENAFNMCRFPGFSYFIVDSYL